MKSKQLDAIDKRLLKCRALIEMVFEELKNLCQIEYARHHSINDFLSNLLGDLLLIAGNPINPH